MDRKERTLRALQGLPVDRPPMVFWHHFVGADMEKENFVDSHVRFYRETGEDFIGSAYPYQAASGSNSG